jgi:hypothetical protein
VYDKIKKNEMGRACITVGGEGAVYRVLVGKLEGDPDIDGRIILRWILRKWDVGVWTGLGWLRIEIGGGQF